MVKFDLCENSVVSEPLSRKCAFKQTIGTWFKSQQNISVTDEVHKGI